MFLKPLCTIDTCQGGSDEQCTEGNLAGCDCFNAPTVIADYGSLTWMSEQQVLLAMLSAHDPGWEYTTVSGYPMGWRAVKFRGSALSPHYQKTIKTTRLLDFR